MPELMRTTNVECRWKYREERNEYIFQLSGRRPKRTWRRIRVHVPRPDLNDCPPNFRTIYILSAFRCLVQWWFIIVGRSAVIIIITDFSSASPIRRFLEPEPAASFRSIPFRSPAPPLWFFAFFSPPSSSSFLLPATSRVSPLLSSPFHSFFSYFSYFSSSRDQRYMRVYMYIHTILRSRI